MILYRSTVIGRSKQVHETKNLWICRSLLPSNSSYVFVSKILGWDFEIWICLFGKADPLNQKEQIYLVGVQPPPSCYPLRGPLNGSGKRSFTISTAQLYTLFPFTTTKTPHKNGIFMKLPATIRNTLAESLPAKAPEKGTGHHSTCIGLTRNHSWTRGHNPNL